MKIVHILATFGSGGIQGFVFSLACEQARRGNNVTVIATDQCTNEHADIQVNVYKEHCVKVYRLNRRKHDKADLLRSIIQCRQIINSLQPDIVNSHATLWHMYGALSTIGSNIKQVCTVHTTPEKWGSLVNLLCKNKPIICCSKPAYEKRVQKNKKAICIENGVDVALIRTNMVVDLRKEFNLPEDTKVVVSVGNLRPPKNYRNLIELAKALDGTDIHFFICGGNHGGPAYDDPKLYEGYNNLHCLGARSDVSAIENGANLFLSSSTFEGLPIAVLEAYFNGIPCVLSPIEQHKVIADVAKVWIPESFDLKDFISSIKEALNCEDNHKSIYMERKEQLIKYGIQRTADEYIEYYNRVLE